MTSPGVVSRSRRRRRSSASVSASACSSVELVGTPRGGRVVAVHRLGRAGGSGPRPPLPGSGPLAGLLDSPVVEEVAQRPSQNHPRQPTAVTPASLVGRACRDPHRRGWLRSLGFGGAEGSGPRSCRAPVCRACPLAGVARRSSLPGRSRQAGGSGSSLWTRRRASFPAAVAGLPLCSAHRPVVEEVAPRPSRNHRSARTSEPG
jgi:hypothetical protein